MGQCCCGVDRRPLGCWTLPEDSVVVHAVSACSRSTMVLTRRFLDRSMLSWHGWTAAGSFDLVGG